MPRGHKRRSDAISRDVSESEDPPAPAQRRQRRQSTSASSAENSEAEPTPDDNDTQSHTSIMIKKLVRFALSCELSRQPLRRTEITAKILKGDSNTSATVRPNFRTIFIGAQKQLQDVFGMELAELPVREKTSLNDRRKAATQRATQKATQGEIQAEESQKRGKDPLLSAQNWILVSILPEAYRTRSELLVPTQADDKVYTALYSMIVSVLYLHTPLSAAQGSEDNVEPLSDAKLLRILKRVNVADFVPIGHERNGMTLEKVLAKMIKEGYIEKRKDTSTGEELVEWLVGPRGKREIGRKGAAGLVRGVYGFGTDGRGKGLELPAVDGNRPAGVKMEKDELEKRLARTLGDVVALNLEGTVEDEGGDGDGDEEADEEEQENQPEPERRRSGRVRRNEDD